MYNTKNKVMYLSKAVTILMMVISVNAFAQDSKMENSTMDTAKQQYEIGENYFYGKTVKKDVQKGISFFKAAAENGYGKAQLN